MSSPKSLWQDPWVQMLAFLCLVSGAMTAHGFLLTGGFSETPSLGGLWTSGPAKTAAPKVLAGPKTAGRWVVDAAGGEGADTARLADAVESAKAGDVIELRPGAYTESLILTKSLTFIGKGAKPEDTVLRVSSTAALTVQGVRARLENLAVLGGPGGAALLAVSSGTLSLSSCAVSGASVAVEARGNGSRLELSSTRLLRNQDGLQVVEGATARLESSEVSENSGTGVRAARGASVTILRSRLRANYGGLEVLDRAKAELSDSLVVESPGKGLLADFGAEVNDFGSTFADNRGPAIAAAGRATLRLDQTQVLAAAGQGVVLSGGAMLIINRGRISDAGGPGIAMSEGSELHLTRTVISSSLGCGLEIASSSAFLDFARLDRNDCGVAFRGRGRLQSNDGDFTGNSKGAFLYSRAYISGIYLNGKNNTPPDFQAYFR